MTTHAINSGALNAVPFPGAEEGASIINLIGTVEVQASLSQIRLRLTATAATAPKAACSVNTTKLRMLLQAVTAPLADAASINALSNVKVEAIDGRAVATVSAGVSIKHEMSASGEVSSINAASCLLISRKSANTQAQAVAQAGSINYGRRSASALGQAIVNSPVFRIEIPVSAIQSAAGQAIAGISIASGIGALSQPSAIGSVNANSLIYLGAQGSSVASASAAQVFLEEPAYPDRQPAQAVAASGVKVIFSEVAHATPSAIGSSPEVTFRVLAQATTVATAIASSAAADFATSIPAPLDRQIVVPPYDRTMKVVA